MIASPNLNLVKFDSIENMIKEFSLKETDQSFIQILDYLKTQHEAGGIVIENNYIDKDYTNEFSNFYSKTFRLRKGYCQRLHFFKESFDNHKDFAEKLSSKNVTYLGFLVKRPLEIGKVGRTIILPKKLDQFFYLCLIKRNVHLLGETMEIKGVPFIEQDAMVMTCAQVSMWIVAKYMHYAHALPRYLPFDITEKATSSFIQLGRSIPSSGLTFEQMMSALSKMGYFPLIYSKPRESDYYKDEKRYEKELSLWEPTETIYQYIESEIPVMVNCDDHVVTIIGHKVSKDNGAVFFDGEKPYITSSSILIDAFIIHDDQAGIYKLLPCNNDCFDLLKTEVGCANLLPKETINDKGEKEFRYKNVLGSVDQIIVPLPDKIYLLGDHVFEISKKLFNREKSFINLIDILTDQSESGNKYARELLRSLFITPENPTLFRIYFIKSSEFKKRITQNTTIDKTIKDNYVSLEMPRFVWITEISNYSIFSKTKCILGEILFDSTANQFDVIGSILSVHMPGYFYKNESGFKPLTGVPIEEPYDILVRYNKHEDVLH